MRYEMISADCHVDLCWLPTDLFTQNASPALSERMPYVVDGPRGPMWTTRAGASLGRVNGMGSAGREYVPGKIHRADRMAATGLYEDGKKGIRRLTDPELRVKDQDRDGVQAEVLYGVLGASSRLNDPDAAVEVMRIYNEWLADFCSAKPGRFAGLASIPNNPIEAAITEVERVAKRGACRGLDIANSPDLKPLWDPYWNPLWEVVNAAGLPLHFHTVGGYVPDHIRKIAMLGSDPTRASLPDAPNVPLPVARAAFAVNITAFQLNMSNVLTSMIFGGVLEHYPRIRLVLGESGIGWIPYVLWRMDAEWEDQFKDLSLTMPPSEYWKRQCWATYQTDPIGIKLLDELGEDKIMWGSDFPHPDGVWPDSKEYVERELGHLPAATRKKIVCDNAAALYGFGA
ncbi:MAG TPA: amidohydrolase family protein [Methylomirabilota bacterium]|nr:amidohydrolase family protein [Methylomirabilota bacterium]